MSYNKNIEPVYCLKRSLKYRDNIYSMLYKPIDNRLKRYYNK